MKTRYLLAMAIVALLALPGFAQAQTWQPLTNVAPFDAGTHLLLPDGTVMVQAQDSSGYGTSNWWRLTPDNTGSYVNGTWTQLASLPGSYAPLYYASAVLPDGRVVVMGGEYNGHSQSETNLGAIYNPSTNSWATLGHPAGSAWNSIGDASGIILADGTFMLGNCCSNEQALLNARNLSWTITGKNKADGNSEEGWALLPDETVLTVDSNNGTHAEKYINGQWISAGSTINRLSDASTLEIGPELRRPDGTVFAMGGTKYNGIYTPPAMRTQTGTWASGPNFPTSTQGQLDMADAPAAELPDGNILMDTSPGIFQKPTYFYEFNGTSLVAVPAPPNAPNDTSYYGRMLVLPTGQVLFADGSNDMEIYTPAGTYQSAWAPTITTVPSTVTHGNTYNVSGTQFSGLNAGAAYGDDAQMATNWALVRITNTSTGHVFYCNTRNPSTTRIATGSLIVSTHFTVPATIETGASTLEVVTNGIPSAAVNITVQ